MIREDYSFLKHVVCTNMIPLGWTDDEISGREEINPVSE